MVEAGRVKSASDQLSSVKQDHPYLNQVQGFTLIEIALAIFILAASLTTLIALESAATVRSLDDQNQFKLMLATRQVLSHIEARNISLDVAESEEPITDYLGQQQGGRPLAELGLSGISMRISVDYWGLPEFEKALKRIRLSVWRDLDPTSPYETLFFIPNDDEEIFDDLIEE